MLHLREQELVERGAELETLTALLDDARRGKGRAVVIEGPAGIGKTRLVAAARERAAAAGMRVLAARGGEFEREFSYGVVRQLFEPLLAGAGAERDTLLAGAAGLVAPLFDASAPAAVEQDDISYATMHGLFWLAANAAAREPLLVAVDDLHWADAPSLRFLAYLLRRLEELPLLVVAGMRPREPGADAVLVGEVASDPAAVLLRPPPLSRGGALRVLREELSGDPDDAFLAACHEASGGNPLLLRQLVNAVEAEGLTPTAANVGRVHELGPRAVSRSVLLRLARLPAEATALARAVAVLGDDADPRHAARLAALDESSASRAAAILAQVDLLRAGTRLDFVHSVVRAAVYTDIPPLEREQGHARAAAVLAGMSAPAERIAAHLLIIPAAGQAWAVPVLRRAAEGSTARGAPDIAAAYLRRALEEPPPEEERLDLLLELGAVETLLDGPAAVEHLREALTLAQGYPLRAQVALMLGRALFYTRRIGESVSLYTQTLAEAPDLDGDLRDRLESGLLTAIVADPLRYRSAPATIERARERAEREDGPGVRRLLGVVAYHDARAGLAGAAQTIARGLRALECRDLLSSDAAYAYATGALIVSDHPDVLRICDDAIASGRRRGSLLAVASWHVWRSMANVYAGALAEAEHDAREAIAAAEALGLSLGMPYAFAFLADALMGQGRLDEAERALGRLGAPAALPDNAHFHYLLDGRARLLLLRGRAREALEAALDCGRRFADVGGENPAIMAWRSQAALAALALGERGQALELAADELEPARRFGAARALGRALRVLGLAEGGERGRELLRQSVDVLTSSPARLEHARSLVELGAALRRANRRSEAREPLRRGLELAVACADAPIVEQGRAELAATGARPRSLVLAGVESLTASERRVARLAAEGQSNRDIAQALFVTPKTVEVHLSSTYRKLGIGSRGQLAEALAGEGAAAGR